MQGILNIDNLKTETIQDVLETSTISMTVGAINLDSTALNFNGNDLPPTSTATLLSTHWFFSSLAFLVFASVDFFKM